MAGLSKLAWQTHQKSPNPPHHGSKHQVWRLCELHGLVLHSLTVNWQVHFLGSPGAAGERCFTVRHATSVSSSHSCGTRTESSAEHHPGPSRTRKALQRCSSRQRPHACTTSEQKATELPPFCLQFSNYWCEFLWTLFQMHKEAPKPFADWPTSSIALQKLIHKFMIHDTPGFQTWNVERLLKI